MAPITPTRTASVMVDDGSRAAMGFGILLADDA
jgi:hypothetical protein